MRLKHSTVIVGLALGLSSQAAQAELLNFDFQGYRNLSFTLDSMPSPVSYSDYNTYFRDVTALFADGTKTGLSLEFNTTTGFGGFSLSNSSHITYYAIASGPQIFSGTTAHPEFSEGSFSLLDYANRFPVAATLTISAVPLPATAPLFGAALLSVAGLGYAAKRKKAAAAA